MKLSKDVLLAAIALAALAGAPAMAADLKMPVKAAPVMLPPPLLWNGFYIGANVGAAWTSANVTTTNGPGVPGIFGLPGNIAAINAAGTGRLDSDAFVTGGIQVGYNWQISPRWLVGVEADINSFSQSTSLAGVAATTLGPVTMTNTLSTDWLATFRARLGLTFNDWLVYGTGGLAVTEQKFTDSFSAPALAGASAFGTSTMTTTKAGWTAGVGVERLFGPWSVKAEYLFVHFGGMSTTTTATAAVGGNTQLVTATTDHLDANIVRVGANYHFK
jgi:outer membrane immunogenic protein